MARDPYKYFRIEARELTGQLGQGLLELERTGSEGVIVPRLLRLAHTLKGAARVVRQPEIADHAHKIEEVLSPFRELAGLVPQDDVDTLLKLIDGITSRVATLAAPDTEGATPAPGAPAALEEVFHAGTTDAARIDDLLDGITETYAQVSGLSEILGLAERARHLTDQVAEQLAPAAGAGPGLTRVRGAADQLREVSARLALGIAGTKGRIDRELREVRDAAEQLRLVPAGALFANFERAARDSARALNKDVAFTGKGGEIRLDARVIRIVQDACLQLVRNAVAHGIEPAAERIAAGKPARGRIDVGVSRRGRYAVFRCEDDGRGIDLGALRSAAIRKGRDAAELDRLDAAGLVRVLLQGGLSTSPEVSEVAGRGIGMDIVRDAVAQLGADFVVNTSMGQGTSFELSVPLSVSSVEALVIQGGAVTVSVPLHAIAHTVRITPSDIHRNSLGDAIVQDGQSIPLVPLGRLLGRAIVPRPSASQTAIIVRGSSGLAAIALDRLHGTASIVVRSLPALAPASPMIAGASLDAAGNPLLMLDADGLVTLALNAGEAPATGAVPVRPLLVIDDSLTTRMLEQSILESAGYMVDVAVSGEDGFERAQRGDYALILVDVEMPGMDGFTFIEQIRKDSKLRHTPAILVTSRNAPEDRQRGRDVGAQHYVVKGEFDQGALLDRIKELVA